MAYDTLLTEKRLDDWVRGNAELARGGIVELVGRLVAASCPSPIDRRFPMGDSIGQPGPDGVLDVSKPFGPFVPKGRSFWEIGTGLNAGKKATQDYKQLTDATPVAVRRESVFVFVTPLSGTRDWDYSWKRASQARWIQRRRKLKKWRDVSVIDGTKLIDWLHCFPAVERWFGHKLGLPLHRLETPEQHWERLRAIGAPQELSPELFLANNHAA